MAQANVISALKHEALRPFLFPCSISFSPVMVPSAAKPRPGHTMKSVEQTRTESDIRRSALMAAAQTGDRTAYETLLRDCVPFIASLARRQGVPSDRTDDVVQEVLLTVHRARATYDPWRSFDAWLRVIVEPPGAAGRRFGTGGRHQQGFLLARQLAAPSRARLFAERRRKIAEREALFSPVYGRAADADTPGDIIGGAIQSRKRGSIFDQTRQ